MRSHRDHTIAEHLSHVPHAAALGMQLVSYEDGKALVRVPYAEHLVGDPDASIIHDGVLTAVLDNASGMAASGDFGEAQRAIATLDLRIDYMRQRSCRRSSCGGRCINYAHCLRRAGHQASEDCTIASSVATFMLGANWATPPGFEAATDPSARASSAEGARRSF